jgi:hypothetical protein
VLGQPGVLGSPVPLYTLPRCTPAAGASALGVDVAARVAVVGRVAVDEERRGAAALRLARLDAAERAP